MTEIQMPRLSDTMEEGVISTWRKQVGDKIARGDVVAEIETDKAVMELEAYDEGTLEKIIVGEGETAPIGAPIAVLGNGSGSSTAAPAPRRGARPEPAAESVSEDAEPAAEPVEPAEPVIASPAGRGVRPKASPLARAVARELGVDLSSVTGTGPGGRIIRADVDAAVENAPAPAVSEPDQVPVADPAGAQVSDDVEEIPLSTIRKVTAKRLVESKRQAPHFYLTSAVDVTDLVAFRAELNERLLAADGPKISLNDLVVKGVATALRANPSLNVSFAGDKLLRHKRIHLGVAVATDSGLLVPVIRDTDRKSVSEIAVESRDKAVRGREGKLRADELSGGTFTISNLGMFGIEQFSAVLNPPEAGILAVGATTDEVRVRDGEFVARKVVRVTLSADHRAVDGAVGAVFLQRLTALLEDPIRIIA